MSTYDIQERILRDAGTPLVTGGDGTVYPTPKRDVKDRHYRALHEGDDPTPWWEPTS